MKFTFFWVKQSTVVPHVSKAHFKATRRAERHLHEAVLSDVLKGPELNSLTVTSTPKPLKNKEIQFKVYVTNPRHTVPWHYNSASHTSLQWWVGCPLNLFSSSKIKRSSTKMSEGGKFGSLHHHQVWLITTTIITYTPLRNSPLLEKKQKH